MKSKITLMKAQLLVALLGLSLFTSAQTLNNDERLLQGKWVLESVSVLDGKDTISMSLDSLNTLGVSIYTQVEIQEDMITLVHYGGNSEKTKYIVDAQYLYFANSSVSICDEWAIFENKLYMERGQDMWWDLSDDSKSMTVTSIYKRK